MFKSGMVTRDALCLTIDGSIFPDEVGHFCYVIHLGVYLYSVVHGNGYLTRISKENSLVITIPGNVSVTRKVTPLVTIPFLYFDVIR